MHDRQITQIDKWMDRQSERDKSKESGCSAGEDNKVVVIRIITSKEKKEKETILTCDKCILINCHFIKTN